MNVVLIPFFIVLMTYCSPYDDAQSALIALLQSTKNEVLIAVYTINSPEIVDTLVQLKKNKVDVRIITDSTQAAGKHEAEELAILEKAHIPVYIGKSVDHQIMHTKFCVVDDTYVAIGSYNWTDVAQKQDNTLTIEEDPMLAKQLHHFWNQIKEDLK